MPLSNAKITLLLILAGLLFILGFSFQGVRGVWEPDEGYYIGASAYMTDQHDYLIPRLGDEEVFLDKPPVMYWGIIGGFKLFGRSEFAARFFTGLCYALTALIVFAFEMTLSGRFGRAFWAAVMYATMIIPFVAANFVTPDTPLALFTTLSLFAFWQIVRPGQTRKGLWFILLGTAAGVGLLTKGPAALIPCGAMFVYLLLQKKVQSFFLNPWIIPAALAFTVIGLSWYVYIAWKLPDAGDYFFDNMIWGRLISEKYQRNPGLSGALIYLPVIFLGTLPWSVLWYDNNRGLVTFFKSQTWKTVMAAPGTCLLACWICVPLLILCLASSKLGLYALPVFPALALVSVRLLPPIAPVDRTAGITPLQPPKTAFVVGWVGLLLVVRLALGAVPSAHNTRSLWQEIKPYLPAGPYEIVTLDDRASGLWFYGAREVENITHRENPYPTYVPAEDIKTELAEMQRDNFPHLFLVEGSKDTAILQNVLPPDSTRQIPLKYDRYLLICTPPADSKIVSETQIRYE